ncbi:hypothetical protein [Vreelandella zhuhanensis]|uniref:hypothetical protein n=1 Tax=Vreelandella zhuhanensis TaxID=2684210 RepID=UPI001922115E|nr:hypothetical protein [Halomonas zhuhanensis]
MVIQVNPIERKGAPKTQQEIQNRINEISFNSSLLKELRAIDFVDRLIRQGKLSSDEYRQVRVHIIENETEMKPLGVSSKMNSELQQSRGERENRVAADVGRTPGSPCRSAEGQLVASPSASPACAIM